MKNKIKCISFIMIVTIMLLTIKSNAAMAIKPGTTIWTSINISDSYAQCYNLRNADSTLGANQLDPHLTLNKDWGAVAYLAISTYGSVNSLTLPTTTINGTSYTTTNGNATGVMDMGKDYTQTASLISGYTDTGYIANLKNNVGTKYVETLSTENTVVNTLGQAIAETYGWWKSDRYYFNSTYPVAIRYNVLGLEGSYVGSYNFNTGGKGQDTSYTIFRPVIWNIK